MMSSITIFKIWNLLPLTLLVHCMGTGIVLGNSSEEGIENVFDNLTIHGNTLPDPQLKRLSGSYMKYRGCYDRWSGTIREDVSFTFKSFYMDSQNPLNCFLYCMESGYPLQPGDSYQLAMVKGLLCACTKWAFFLKQILIEEYCDIECDPGEGEAHNSCGGNLAFSVYCSIEDEWCKKGDLSPKKVLEDYSLEVLTDEMFVTSINVSNHQCIECFYFNCNVGGIDGSFNHSMDYFPRNDPPACILHCRRTLKDTNFVAAALLWSTSNQLPICHCMEDFPTPESYHLMEDGMCSSECPGDDGFTCGEIDTPFILSVYCTGRSKDCFILQQPKTTTTTQSTSTRKPGITSTMTTQETTTRGTTRETSTGTTELPGNCTLKCRAVFDDTLWVACAGTQASKKCNTESHGTIFWQCLANGSFATPRPDTRNCTSGWFTEVLDSYISFLENNDQSLTKLNAEFLLDKIRKECWITGRNKNPYYGHEVKEIAKLIVKIVDCTNVTSENEFVELIHDSLSVSCILLYNRDQWEEFADDSIRMEMGNEFFRAMEQSVLMLSKFDGTEDFTTYFAPRPMHDMFLLDYGVGMAGKDLVFPRNGSAHDSHAVLEKGWEIMGVKADYVGYTLDSEFYQDIFPPCMNNISKLETDEVQIPKIFNSELLSLTINNPSGEGLSAQSSRGYLNGKKVTITFKHNVDAWGDKPQTILRKLHLNETQKVAMSTAACVFWSTSDMMWSSEGCKVIKVNRTCTVCECDHLTSFAVLMDPHNYAGKDFTLEVITFILCPVSIVCLIMSIIIFSSVKSIHNLRTVITKNLCVCLLIGTILVLFFVDRNYIDMGREFCIVVGVMTHYVYLAAFVWMQIEGVHLYNMVVRVFDTGKNPKTLYRILAYGLPVIIVGITLMVGYLLGDEPYGGEMYCWLTGPYIWSFNIPVALVVILNSIVLIKALKTAHGIKAPTATIKARQVPYKTWIRGSFSITVLLGITWLPGFLMAADATILGNIGAYLFVLLNGSQGIFLFLFHCYLNDNVRKATGKNVSSWVSSVSSKNPFAPGVKKSDGMQLFTSESSGSGSVNA